MVTRPWHVPPIVELYPPGSAAHPVRGQMSPRPLTEVTTHQPAAFDPNKHWNKLRDGGEKGGRTRWDERHLLSTLHDSLGYSDKLVCLWCFRLFVLQSCVANVQCGGESLCILQYVSLLWWSMTLSKFHILCGLDSQRGTKMQNIGRPGGLGVKTPYKHNGPSVIPV